MHVLDLLAARGFIQSHTDLDALRGHMDAGPVTFYVGFDPTGDSLHVGHLLPVMAMHWLQAAGHKPIVLLGGGTAMVGDPSGKDKSREMITPDQIAHNLAGQRVQFGRFLDLGEGPSGAVMVNNADWLMDLGYIRFLRDVGKHFSVNKMLTAESAKQRLERNQGLSFIEFNYHLLQSYDFLVLLREHGCTLQLGGDDQWFNILGGADLIRRETGTVAHALTVPLLARADGKKMGKTESGAVWLDPARVSAYDYFQYWVNVDDRDVVRFLKLYTRLPLARIAELEALEGADVREAKKVLAREATVLAHGEAAATEAAAAAAKVFSGGASADMPTFKVALPAPVVDLMAASGLCKSKGEARRLIKQGGARIEGERVTSVDAILASDAVLWAGKKRAVRILGGGG
jgi:tyrosyl-tRNA synthetase